MGLQKRKGWREQVITKVIKATSVMCESTVIRSRGSLQSSQLTEWVAKVLVQIRIATKRLETIGETMQTTTMVCCWVEGSVLMTIVKGEIICEMLFQKVKNNVENPSLGHKHIADPTDR